MNQMEQNVVNSFRLAKSDIIKMQNSLAEVNERQKNILVLLGDSKKREAQLALRVKELNEKVRTNMGAIRTNQSKIDTNREVLAKRPRTVVREKIKVIRASRRASKVYLASKTGKSVHEKNCPFAKNIKPKSKLVFKSKSKALNAGYRPCDCMKRH